MINTLFIHSTTQTPQTSSPSEIRNSCPRKFTFCFAIRNSFFLPLFAIGSCTGKIQLTVLLAMVGKIIHKFIKNNTKSANCNSTNNNHIFYELFLLLLRCFNFCFVFISVFLTFVAMQFCMP